MEIRQDDPTAPYVSDLLNYHLRELRDVMGAHAFAFDASGLSSSDVTFWTAWRGDELTGFAALRQLDARYGEVKSMRAAPSARGTGVGRALLDHAVEEARRRSYAALYLETGTAPLHESAILLYRRSGFVNCEPFSDYKPSPHNQFMKLIL